MRKIELICFVSSNDSVVASLSAIRAFSLQNASEVNSGQPPLQFDFDPEFLLSKTHIGRPTTTTAWGTSDRAVQDREKHYDGFALEELFPSSVIWTQRSLQQWQSRIV
jgi:hypothetical protein